MVMILINAKVINAIENEESVKYERDVILL